MFKNVKIRNKLLMGFISIALIAAIIGLIGYFGVNQLKKTQNDIISNKLPGIMSLMNLNGAINDIVIAERGIINVNMMDPAVRKAQYAWIDERWIRIDEAWKTFNAFSKTKEEEEALKKYLTSYEQWKGFHKELINLGKQKDQLFASGYKPNDIKVIKIDSACFKTYMSSRDSWLASVKSLEELITINNNIIKADNEHSNSNASSAIILIIVALVIGVMLAIVLGFIIAGNIQGIIKSVIKQTTDLIDSAINGKLKVRGEPEKINAEFREIIVGINKTLDAVIGPLNIAAEYLDKFSKGEIPDKMTENYNGDFNILKNNINK